MKLSVILWKSLQEEMSKREHIEASVYELQEAVKELKGKGKAKAKAKSKRKYYLNNNIWEMHHQEIIMQIILIKLMK